MPSLVAGARGQGEWPTFSAPEAGNMRLSCVYAVSCACDFWLLRVKPCVVTLNTTTAERKQWSLVMVFKR